MKPKRQSGCYPTKHCECARDEPRRCTNFAYRGRSAALRGKFQRMPQLQLHLVTCQLFEDGKELITFRSMADLRQNIDYWLSREAERRSIAEAGMRRAHAEHTYALRLGLLLDTLAGTQHGYPTPQIRYAM